MPRIIWVLAIWILLGLSAKAQLPAIIIPDSSLNADTLQITAEYFQPSASKGWGDYSDQLNRVWSDSVGNRLILLQCQRYAHGDLLISRWGYYQKILGVGIAQKPESGTKFTFSYCKLKSDNRLRQAVPKILEREHPNLIFKW